MARGPATNDLDELLRAADYVSIHAPLTPETRELIDERALRLMKPDRLADQHLARRR